MSTREEGFLSRWSRRKRGELPGPKGEAAPPPAVVPKGAPDPVPEGSPDPVPEGAPGPVPEAFDPATLPPLESLTGASDFTAFLRPGVPAPLRQAALRRAWTLDPAIRDFIGPADYAWDYNAPDGVPGFALQLGGDVTRMLAQAIGALEDLAKPGEQPGEGPGKGPGEGPGKEPGETPAGAAKAAPPVTLAVEGPVEGPVEAPVAAPVVVAAVAEGPLPGAAEPPPTAPVPARRHGRAIPV